MQDNHNPTDGPAIKSTTSSTEDHGVPIDLKGLEQRLKERAEAGWPDSGRRLPETPAPKPEEQPHSGEVQATLQFGWKKAKGPPLPPRKKTVS
jgi:hypothetical protein